MKTLYYISTLSEYYRLNQAISEAKGYDLTDDTARYAPMNPSLAMVNIQGSEEGSTYDLACVMKITVDVQENYPEAFNGAVAIGGLLDSYIPATETLTDLEVEGMTTAQIDYLLMHYNEVGDRSIAAIIAESQPRSAASDKAVESLANDNIIIVTNE